MIKDKSHILTALGYRESEYIEAVETIKNLVAKKYIDGDYIFKAHDEKGFRVGFVIDFPGKNEDSGKIYKLKTGWSIFPNGKLKCNTLIGGLTK